MQLVWFLCLNELFNAKAISVDSRRTAVILFKPYLVGVHPFSKGISPKMNVTAWPKFKLAYFEVTVQHFRQLHHEKFTLCNRYLVYARVKFLYTTNISLFLSSLTLHQPMKSGGARGVVVIAVGNEHGDTSSNPGRD